MNSKTLLHDLFSPLRSNKAESGDLPESDPALFEAAALSTIPDLRFEPETERPAGTATGLPLGKQQAQPVFSSELKACGTAPGK